MTQVTLKVLPRAQQRLTKVLPNLDFPAAQRAMSAALGSPLDVDAAAHVPDRAGRGSKTIIRLQGFGPSLVARSARMDELLGRFGSVYDAVPEEAAKSWHSLRSLDCLDMAAPLWRISVAPSRAPALVSKLPGEWAADWGGGLIWLASSSDPVTIRATVSQAGGRAMLVRAPQEIWSRIPAFHPAERSISVLEERLRRAFDPLGIFETGRFWTE
jgi:glycolate oxidase FAD binding subunit